MKTAIKRGLIIAVVLVAIAFIPGLGNYAITFLAPPRIYIVLGVLILAALMTIIHNQKKGE
jgi:hypothetical protein